jgi:hypothetical protein
MYYYLSIHDQLGHILKKFSINDLKHKNDDNYVLKDIRDGRIYKKLLNSIDGNALKNQEAFTFSLNTDGISPANKSNLTIWPIFLVINELPIESRYSIDNTILAGKLFYEIKKKLSLNLIF